MIARNHIWRHVASLSLCLLLKVTGLCLYLEFTLKLEAFQALSLLLDKGNCLSLWLVAFVEQELLEVCQQHLIDIESGIQYQHRQHELIWRFKEILREINNKHDWSLCLAKYFNAKCKERIFYYFIIHTLWFTISNYVISYADFAISLL